MKKICTLLVLCGLAAFTTGCDKKPAATGGGTSTSATPDAGGSSTTATK